MLKIKKACLEITRTWAHRAILKGPELVHKLGPPSPASSEATSSYFITHLPDTKANN